MSVEFDKADTNKVKLYYRTFDNEGTEIIRLKAKPSAVLLNDTPLTENTEEGYTWTTLEKGGVLSIKRKNGNRVIVME